MTLHGHDWLINGEQHHRSEPVKAGELQVWDIVNETGMDHPFHLHGFFFQVLSRNDVAEASARRVWKDTINIPAKSSIKAIARFDEPGRWMYHCHILEHAEGGMMGEVSIP